MLEYSSLSAKRVDCLRSVSVNQKRLHATLHLGFLFCTLGVLLFHEGKNVSVVVSGDMVPRLMILLLLEVRGKVMSSVCPPGKGIPQSLVPGPFRRTGGGGGLEGTLSWSWPGGGWGWGRVWRVPLSYSWPGGWGKVMGRGRVVGHPCHGPGWGGEEG